MQLVFSKDQIKQAIQKIADQVSEYLEQVQEDVHFVTVLREGIHFSIDLAQKLEKYSLIFDYIFLENVNPNNRELAIEKDIFLPVKDKTVLLCSVLIRTGYEISFIENYLRIRGCKQIKTVSLICKKGAYKKPDFYYFLTEPSDYLVGYGLDYNEKYRNLQEIYKIK
ncbi:MAG: phosphoribosyltransferase family protein [bacterium]